MPSLIRWRLVGLVVLGCANLVLLAVVLAAFVMADRGGDWLLYREAARRVFDGGLYAFDADYAYRYSPLAAYAFAVIVPLGYWAWAAAHVAVLALLPWRVALVALVSFPLWADVYNGNIMAFVFVAAYLALTGSRWATWVFLILSVLAPRPLMLPVLAWILWKRPAWRVPFAILAVVSVAAALATGWGTEWLASLARGADDIGSRMDIGPSNLLGGWWVPLGLALAGVLTWRGRLGLASLAASPYWLPYYLLMGLLELRQDRRPDAVEAGAGGNR